MNCNGVKQRLDDYLDRALGAEDIAAVERHADACPDCRALLSREMCALRALRTLPAPEPTEAFLDRTFERAASQAAARRRWHIPGLALAASVVLMLAASLFLKTGTPPVEDLPGLAVALNQVQNVSLVFESEHAMNNARFTIELPEGIELMGFPGQRAISWEGNLIQGRNLLVLPVEARGGHGGKLVAYVTYVGKSKNFALQMNVVPPVGAPISLQEQRATAVTVM